MSVSKNINFQKGFKIIKDFGWNIAASVIITAFLQLVVYPLLARWFNSDSYGQILTIMGIANIFIVSIGGGLNNARLIQNEKYAESDGGDFNVFLGLFNTVGCLVFAIILLVSFKLSVLNLIVVIGYVLFGIIRGYWSVAYRLEINYVSNLKMNVIVTLGYFVGLVFVKFTQVWAFSFLIAEMFGVIYVCMNTKLYKENFKCTKLWDSSLRTIIILILVTLISNVIIYLDRLVLYPMLGGEQVSIFSVSSFVGKSVGILITPIAAVLLSYYAQKDFKMTLKKYWLINLLMIVSTILIGLITIIFAPWLTRILYPTLIEKALPFIFISNISTLVGVLSNVVSPATLKYSNMRWQLFVQFAYIVMYFGLGVFSLKIGGLYSFCISNLIVNSVRLFMLLIIGHYGIKQLTSKSCIPD